jgi:hypothetical protein
MASNDKSDQIITALASADCPKCQGFVALKGRGKRGQKIRLEGRCPNNHLVLFPHTVR